MAATDVLIEV